MDGMDVVATLSREGCSEQDNLVASGLAMLVGELRSMKQEIQVQGSNLGSKIGDVNNEIRKLKGEVQEQSSKINGLNNKVEKLTEQGEKLTKQGEKLENKVNDLSVEVKQQGSKLDKLTEQSNSLDSKVTSLSSELGSLNDKLEKQGEDLKGKMVGLRSDMKEQGAEVKERINVLEDRMNEQSKQVEIQITSLKEELDCKLDKQSSELENKMNELSSNVSSKIAEVSKNVDSRMAELSSEVTSKTADLSNVIQKQGDSVQQEIKEMKQENVQLLQSFQVENRLEMQRAEVRLERRIEHTSAKLANVIDDKVGAAKVATSRDMDSLVQQVRSEVEEQRKKDDCWKEEVDGDIQELERRGVADRACMQVVACSLQQTNQYVQDMQGKVSRGLQRLEKMVTSNGKSIQNSLQELSQESSDLKEERIASQVRGEVEKVRIEISKEVKDSLDVLQERIQKNLEEQEQENERLKLDIKIEERKRFHEVEQVREEMDDIVNELRWINDDIDELKEVTGHSNQELEQQASSTQKISEEVQALQEKVELLSSNQNVDSSVKEDEGCEPRGTVASGTLHLNNARKLGDEQAKTSVSHLLDIKFDDTGKMHPLEFVEYFDKAFKTAGLDDISMIRMMSKQMVGDAEVWAGCYVPDHHDYQQFRQAFLNSFWTIDDQVTEKMKFFTPKQYTEDQGKMRDYFWQSLMPTHYWEDIKEDEILEVIVRRFPKDVRVAMIGVKRKTKQEISKILEGFDDRREQQLQEEEEEERERVRLATLNYSYEYQDEGYGYQGDDYGRDEEDQYDDGCQEDQRVDEACRYEDEQSVHQQTADDCHHSYQCVERGVERYDAKGKHNNWLQYYKQCQRAAPTSWGEEYQEGNGKRDENYQWGGNGWPSDDQQSLQPQSPPKCERKKDKAGRKQLKY